MKKLEAVGWQRLLWKQTKFGAYDFELRAGEDLVGVLYWPKFLSERAVAECAAGKWRVDRVGFFRRRTVVTEADSGLEVASFEAGWLGDGDLVLSDGRAFQWYRTKAFLNNAWALADESGNAVLEVKTWMHWFKYRADVALHVEPGARPELPLLVLTAWYLGFMQMQDAAAVVAATCVC
jgi:hypothetical protein